MAFQKRRFKAVEYFNGYEVEDTLTGESHWLSDGVDMLFDENGEALKPGTRKFLKVLEASLNADVQETLDAYFS